MNSKVCFCLSMALSSFSFASAVVIAYDDASDATYNSGWAAASNGGYGFGAWFFSPFAINGMGDSNLNGSLGGPGINIGGRSWQAEHAPGWSGAVAGRTLNSFNLGDSLEVDVDFGSVSNSGQGVALLGPMDACQVQAVSTSSQLLINTFAGTFVTSTPYSDGGFRVRFDWVSGTSLNVSITSFATTLTQSYSVAFQGASGSYTVGLQSENPVPGQALYASRMVVHSPVPEPATLLALGLGAVGLLNSRRHRI